MKSRSVLQVILTILSGVSLAAGAVPNRLSRPLERQGTFQLKGQVKSWTAKATDNGPVADTLAVPSMMIALQPTAAQKSDMEQFLRELQDPSSANYHKFLTAAEFADRFGASQSDMGKIQTWLQGHGLTVDGIGNGRIFVRFHGTAGQVRSAFQTQLHQYTMNGQTHIANATAPVVPSELGPMVQSIRGLHDVRMLPLLKANARPEYTDGIGNHSLSPTDIATIYNIAPLQAQGINGTGQSIVIIGATDLSSTGGADVVADTAAYRTKYGLPTGTIQTLLVGTSPGVNVGAQEEAALDLQIASAVAPNATLIYLNDADPEDGIAVAIDNQLAPVISSSYADGNFGFSNACDAADSPYDALFQQAMAQYANILGITWVNASGDTGSAGCDYNVAKASQGRSVTLPAGVPEVTAIGGTRFLEGAVSFWNSSNAAGGGSAKGYIPEIAWNDTALDGSLSATGGGASVVFTKPFWQAGPGVPADNVRYVPDVSFAASADHDPYRIVYNTKDYQFGGTSAGAPLFSAIVALLNQYAGTKGVGNINPALYSLAQSTPSVFHDVVIGDNIVPCVAGSPDCSNGYLAGYTAGPGYDATTGLGSLDVTALFTSWGQKVAAVATTMSVTTPASTITLNSNVLLTATVKAASGTATPTGTVTFRVGANNSDGDYWYYLGTATLSGSGGTATATFNFYPNHAVGYYVNPTQFSAGGLPIAVMYSGDSNFRGSGVTGSLGLRSPAATNSAVIPSVSPSALAPVAPDADGYTYFFRATVTEYNGTPTTLTDFKIDGVSYASQIPALFGGNTLPAGGILSGNIRWNPPTAPYTTIVEFSGKDGNGAAWTQQVPLIVTARQLTGNMILSSDTPGVYPNASNSSCPWQEQLQLHETNGREVILNGFSANGSDISSSMQQFFGTLRLAPFGTATAKLCFNSNPTQQNGGSLQWEAFGNDDLGNPMYSTVTSTYYSTVTNATTISASPSTAVLSIASPNQSASTSLSIAVGNSNVGWSVNVYPANKTTNWLTAYPAAGYGNGTVTLTANGAGFTPGVYYAKIVITGDGSTYHPLPRIVSIPVVLQIGQTGSVTISGVTNAASFAQGYAPGALVAVFGSNLASSSASAGSIPLPRSLGGSTATVNGVPAPFWFVSPNQVNLQIPYETGAGNAVLGINNNGSVGYSIIQMSTAVPGIFSNNGFVTPVSSAQAGGYAFLYITGEGDITPFLATGASPRQGTPISSLPVPYSPVTVTVGGIDAPVLFAGITPGSVGVSQVNFQVPTGLSGVQPVIVKVNGVSSSPVNLTITK